MIVTRAFAIQTNKYGNIHMGVRVVRMLERCLDAKHHDHRAIVTELLKKQDRGYIPIFNAMSSLRPSTTDSKLPRNVIFNHSLEDRTFSRHSPWHTQRFHLHLAWTLRKLELVSYFSVGFILATISPRSTKLIGTSATLYPMPFALTISSYA